MPFDGSGNFTRSYNFVQDKNNGIKIVASRVDGEFDNFATAMNQVMMRNGITPLTGNLNMGTNTINSLGNGTVGTPAIRFNSDPTTGIFSPAYGQISLAAGGTERLQANSNGVQIFGLLNTTQTISSGGGISPNTIANWYLSLNAGNPLINFDSNDYQQYDKTNNLHQFIIGGGEQFRVFGGGVKSYGQTRFNDDAFMALMSGGAPVIQFDVGDWQDYDRTGNFHRFIVGAVEQARIFNGGIKTYGEMRFADDSFKAYLTTGNPNFNFDSGDWQQYDRTNNRHQWFVNSTERLRADFNGVSSFGNLYPGGDANYYHLMSGANPTTSHDATDWSDYIRASNQYRWIIANSEMYRVEPTGPMSFGFHRFGGDINFYSGFSGAAPIINFDANDYMAYDRTGNAFNFYTGGTSRLGIGSGGIGITGSAIATSEIISQNSAVRSTNTTTGRSIRMIMQSDNNGVMYYNNGTTDTALFAYGVNSYIGFGPEIRAPTMSIDANYYKTLISGNPYLNMDANDSFMFDRTANTFAFNIASAQKFRIQPDGNIVASSGVYDNGGFNVRSAGDFSGAQWYIDTKMQNGQTYRRTGGSIALGTDSSGVVNLTYPFTSLVSAGIGSATTVNVNEDACFVNIISGSQIRVVNGATAQTLGWWAEGIV